MTDDRQPVHLDGLIGVVERGLYDMVIIPGPSVFVLDQVGPVVRRLEAAGCRAVQPYPDQDVREACGP